MGLEIRPERDFDIVNPENDPRYRDYWGSYHEIMARRGVTPDLARAIMRTNTTAIGARHGPSRRGRQPDLRHVRRVPLAPELRHARCSATHELHPTGALSLMILEDGPLFIADTHVHIAPTPEQIAETAIGAARHVRRFGIEPKIALCSQSQFGNSVRATRASACAPRSRILDSKPRDFCYEGEMNVDAALDADLRARLLPEQPDGRARPTC